MHSLFLLTHPTYSPAQESLIAMLRADNARMHAELESCGYVPPAAVRASPLYRDAEASAAEQRDARAALSARGEEAPWKRG